jgi:hypothetical protein
MALDDTLHAEIVEMPTPVHDRHVVHAPVAEERNVLPAIHVGKTKDVE